MLALPLSAGPVLFSSVTAALICLHVARRVHKAGVEHYSSRILILSAITNTASVALMLLLLGVIAFRSMLTFADFPVVDVGVASLFLILPIRVIWNYVRTPGRIPRRLGLSPLRREDHRIEVATIARVLGIAEPIMSSSPRCQTPFVFGHNSRNAHLVLPDSWGQMDASSRYIMLCHELAHIRNLDVGFLTWAMAFLRDLKWALLLSPVVLALSLVGEQEYFSQAAMLYLVSLLILWFLTNVVVRSRELLADATVATLIDAGKILRTFDEILLAPETGYRLGDKTFSGMVSHLRGRLADKAMFSKHAAFWKVIARFAELSFQNHPSVAMRMNAVRSWRTAGEGSSARDQHPFWAGLTLGLLSAFVALGGFWTGKYMLGWQDTEQIVLLSYHCWGSIGPLAAAFVALFFVLPAWSSLLPHVPTSRTLARLLARYLYGLLGACCVLPLILLGGWSHLEIQMLFVLSFLWALFTLLIGIGVEIVMLSLWLLMRYRQNHTLIDLAWILYSYSIGLLAVFCYLICGFIFLSAGWSLAAGSLMFGLFVGLAVLQVISRDSRISGTDQYLVIVPPPVSIRLEGKRYRDWSPFAGFLHMITFCLLPAGVVSTILWVRGCHTLGQPSTTALLRLKIFEGVSR